MSTASIQRTFRNQPTVTALVAFLFSRDRYIDMAVEHSMSVSLEAADLRRRYDAGEYPSANWESEAKEQVKKYADSLAEGLWKSLQISVVCAAVVLVILYLLGYVRPDLPFSAQKAIAGLALFLGVWGGLLQANPPIETWKKKALHENLHGLLSKLLIVLAFVFGILSALL